MPRASEIPGGHKVQFEQTARALSALGLDVRTSFDAGPSLDDLEVVHGFGLNAAEVHACRARRLPVVLSTIYWDRDYRMSGGRTSTSLRARLGRIKVSARLARSAMGGRSGLLRTCLDEASDEVQTIAALSAADILLPNAQGEADAIVSDLGVATPIRIVPNAVSPEAFSAGSADLQERTKVLCVGRIEPHKNQLGLIEALRGCGLELAIAGPVHPHHPDYLAACKKAAGDSVEFLGFVDDDALPALYQSARVHVLPSWFETTGLSSLEAALSGCNVVTTSRGHASEYFGDLAWYCDPADPATIRDAVLKAFHAQRRPGLAERVLARYTWAHTAEATLEAYRLLLPG